MNLAFHSRLTRAVTIIGLLLLIGVITAATCGFLYVGRKALAAGHRIEAAHDAAISNAMNVVDKMPILRDDLFLDAPGAVWTEITNAPGWWRVEIPDEEFAQAIADNQEWAILTASDLGGPWIDSGNRESGNPASIRQLLFDWCNLEAPYALGGLHGAGQQIRFYRAVRPEDVPSPPETK